MFQSLKDFLSIYTWREFWIAASCGFLVVGCWLLFCLLLHIPIDWLRTLLVWLLIFVLSFFAGSADWHKGVENR